jgi:hypothetical protein
MGMQGESNWTLSFFAGFYAFRVSLSREAILRQTASLYTARVYKLRQTAKLDFCRLAAIVVSSRKRRLGSFDPASPPPHHTGSIHQS